MTYPVTIVDDFFENPDQIVEMAEGMKYVTPDTGNWPGTRTKMMHLENDRFFNYFGEKLHLLFHDHAPDYWNMQLHFQRIEPFAGDKWDRRNRGWIHQDIDTFFGGIVYLGKDPEPDTGTSIYRVKNGYALQYADEISMKEKLYRGEEINIDEYNRAYDSAHDQYIETVKVENVYNRFVMFNNKVHHGVQTFGTKPRLTLNFFGMAMTGKIPPLLKAR